MADVEYVDYINNNMKPHHRILIAVSIVMAIFLPVIIVTSFSANINETVKADKRQATPKHLRASLFSDNTSPQKQSAASSQVVSAVVDPIINLSNVALEYNDQGKSFGISMVELDGKNRTGDYNGDNIFVSASTYKLFTAYSALIRIEDGSWDWSDANIVGEKNLMTCFNDMISFSDNDCAEAITSSIGYQTVTSEAQALGCVDTTLISSDGYARTTANDLALFLAKLYKGQILTQQSSRNILIDAMKNNIYRNGIPSGITDDIVANKVGFIDGYLNDASIVYDTLGNYVLVIMTNNSSWGEIANLASKINLLHQQ